jgi:homoserine dehydrogenase
MGKHVCTSNKELVVNYGAELLALAKEREINFMFEASVGGGIPIVRPMNLALTTDEVLAVAGILNGTTNYILTQMNSFGKSFEEALAEAQGLGYAEKDPANDVEGYDACRKLAILLSLATGRQVDYRDIETEGITKLQKADFSFARMFGHTIKLMVDGRIVPGGVEALTAPMLVHHQHPLANIADVFNRVLVQAKMTTDVMFTGRGAGKFPTAGAVVSDIVDVAKHLNRHIQYSWSQEPEPVLPRSRYGKRRMIRVAAHDIPLAYDAVRGLYGDPAPIYELAEYPNELAWLAPRETEAAAGERLKRLAEAPGVGSVLSSILLYEPLKL